MYGSKYIQLISGRWNHIGYLDTTLLFLPASTVNNGILPKGTALQPLAGDDTKAQLASGFSYGFTTQDISALGQTSLQAFKDRNIGKADLPVTVGKPVSLRLPSPGSIIEFRGVGAAGPGNLVVTSGTGLLSASTARGTKLSFIQGSLRVAQTGDISQYICQDASSVVIDGVTCVQIRAQRYDAGIV